MLYFIYALFLYFIFILNFFLYIYLFISEKHTKMNVLPY